MSLPITLRGHHLDNLSYYVFWERFGSEFNMKNQRNFYLEGIKKDHGKYFVSRMLKVYSAILKDPSLQVRLVDIQDDVCNSNCQLKNKQFNCDGLLKEDHEKASAYGLEIREEPYFASEIIDAVLCSMGLKS